MTTKQLERAAVRAHHRGIRFAEFWTEYAAAVREATGHDRQRFARLYHRLLMLTISGDTDGMATVGDNDFAPWERDDAAHEPHDTATRARWQHGLPMATTDRGVGGV